MDFLRVLTDLNQICYTAIIMIMDKIFFGTSLTLIFRRYWALQFPLNMENISEI